MIREYNASITNTRDIIKAITTNRVSNFAREEKISSKFFLVSSAMEVAVKRLLELK